MSLSVPWMFTDVGKEIAMMGISVKDFSHEVTTFRGDEGWDFIVGF